MTYMDLLSYSAIGYLRAERKYDPSRGIKFKTYAEHRIRGAIMDGIRDWIEGSRHKAVPVMVPITWDVQGGLLPELRGDIDEITEQRCG